jgi:hypothetical protein
MTQLAFGLSSSQLILHASPEYIPHPPEIGPPEKAIREREISTRERVRVREIKRERTCGRPRAAAGERETESDARES